MKQKLMLKASLLAVVLSFFSILLFGCGKPHPPTSRADLESQSEGLQLMATYDPRFDNIVAGYRLLSITFTNQSPNLIELDAKKDTWTLTTRNGAEVKAVNNLRFVDRQRWNRLSPRAQEVIEYPRVILRNTTVTFDVLFPKEIDLNGFTRVDFFSSSLKKSFVGGSAYGEIPEEETDKKKTPPAQPKPSKNKK